MSRYKSECRGLGESYYYSLGILVVQIYFLPTSRPCIKHYSQLVFELVPEVQLLPN